MSTKNIHCLFQVAVSSVEFAIREQGVTGKTCQEDDIAASKAIAAYESASGRDFWEDYER